MQLDRRLAQGRFDRRRGWSAVAAGAALIGTILAGSGTTAAPSVRYASPSGTGSACTAGAPCDLVVALSDADPGQIVDIRGDLGPYSIFTGIDAAPGITVRGSHGTPEIQLWVDTLAFRHAKVTGLRVVADIDGTAVRLADGGRLDRVWVEQSGAGHACYVAHGATLRNTACIALGDSDKAVETDGSVTLRNVTAYGGWESAIKLYGRHDQCGCSKALVTIINSIAKAGPGGKDLWLETDGTATITVKPTTSNYRTTKLVGPKAKRTLVSSRTNQTSKAKRPRFIDAASGNVRAKAGSPTIDRGVTSSRKNGAKDVDGRPRRLGTRTDIGAAEYSPPNTTILTGPSGSNTDDTPELTFSATRVGSTFGCKVDAASWVTCSSPFTTDPLAPGAHTVRVRAIDSLGYVDPSPAKRSFSVTVN